MEALLRVREADGTERFVPYGEAAAYAEAAKDAGVAFTLLRSALDAEGRHYDVPEEEWQDFEAAAAKERVAVERRHPFRDDASRRFVAADGRSFDVPNAEREDFLAAAKAEGATIVSESPGVRWLSEEEADEALEGGIDWGEMGKRALEGWKFPARLAMNVAEGAVAIPTLAALGAEYGLQKAGVLGEGRHPVGQYGLKAVQALERAKPEYSLATGSDSWRDPAGIIHNVASGSLGALEFIGEIAATAGVGGAASAAARKGLKEGVKATVGAAGRRMATEAERRAARKAAGTLGVSSVDMADRAAATAFAEAYARQLPRELWKEGARRFAKQALKPNYWKLDMASRNALETYDTFMRTGNDEDRAMLNALGDGALGYLLLSLGDGAGAFSGGLRAGGGTQILRALTQGSARPWLKAELAGTGIRMLGGAVAQGGSTHGHLRALREAVGEEAVDDETLWGSTAIAALFGAGMGLVSSFRPLRQAALHDKELALGRQAMADGGPAWRPSEGQRGWARLDLPEGGTRPDGLPGARSPAPFRPVAVHESGDVLFKDGSVWRAKTQDWLMPGGAVVDARGDVVTVAPGAPAAGQGAGAGAMPEAGAAASARTGAEDLGLFELIRSGETKVHNVPLADIRPNTQIIQFKADADPETGVVRGQELQGEYQPLPSKPVLLWQAADGHLEPATGRHRIDLARRNGMETIPANIIREEDGWTPERTRLLDAMDNILDEKGSDQDFVAFFRGTDLDPETAARKGLLARKKGRDAFEVAKNGGEDLYSLVMGRDPWVTMDKAAAISREAPRRLGAFAEGVQRAVVKAVRERNLTADGAAIMARGLMSARRRRAEAGGAVQDDLFGADDTALAFAAEEASYADGKRRETVRALRRVNAALDKGYALDLKDDFAKGLGIQDPKDAGQLRAAAERLRKTVTRWENYHTDPELYGEAHAYAKEALGVPDVLVERPDGTLATDREMAADLHPEGTDALGGVLPSPSPEEAAPQAESDAAANGPGFVPLEKGEDLNRLEKRLRDAKDAPMRNERFGLTSSIATGGNVSKLATVNHKGGEDTNAHKFAMKNLAALYAKASVAVRHADKKLVGNERSAGHYIRLFAPFRFDGQTYVALISQRESKAAPGVHAIEALEVVPTEAIKAEAGLAFSSGHGRGLRPDGSASPTRSALTEEKIAYTLGDVNLTRPEHLDGTPYPAEALLEDVRDAAARLEPRAAGSGGASGAGTGPEGGVLLSPSPEGEAFGEAVPQAEIDAAANGPGFVPLGKGESFGELERELKANIRTPLKNDRFGLASSIGTGRNVSKLSVVNHKGGEDANAHKFAMKNLAGLYARASVAVRHADKKLVGTKGRAGHYIRLFAPFRFDGQTYVALISQRESEAAPGVHAIEALEVVPTEAIKAEDGSAFTSRREQRLRAAGSASPIRSALTEEKIAYTLGDVNLTRPERLDGTPYPADALLEDVRDAAARFELQAVGARPSTGGAGTLGSREARAPIREPRLLNGERILPDGPYPMHGRVAPLGGMPGSLAREQGGIALGLSDLVLMYHELTGGRLPKVIANRARMGRALGRYFVGENTIELAAQIFGFLDESDVADLRRRLEGMGYFRHLDPAWAAAHNQKTVRLERSRSNARLEKEVRELSKARVREKQEGYREVSVMAHELWHLIDDQDGGLNGRGNLVGHLAALKRHMRDAFPAEGLAGNGELMAEAKAFIPAWRGVKDEKDTAYFTGAPEETLAEIGAAYFVAPWTLRRLAPKLFAAFDAAIRRHPKACEAYDRAVGYIASGGREARVAEAVSGSWTREAQASYRALQRQAKGADLSFRRNLMRLNAFLWDRRGPSIMLYNEGSRNVLRELRKELRAGTVSKEDYEAAERKYEDGLAILRKRHLDYTRLGTGLARQYLIDLNGDFMSRLAAVDPNPDIARLEVEQYAHFKRVIELGGRATAYGVTPAQARRNLAAQARQLGLEKMRKVVTAWKAFRSTYEREVIENRAVQRMLGPKMVALMRANTSYVTMRHTLTPEEAERMALRLSDKTKANGVALEIALERLLPGGTNAEGSASRYLKTLKSSLQATESPLLATMKTAVGLITAAERNAAIADLADALRSTLHKEVAIVPWGKAARTQRHAPVEFWEDGEHKALMVPKVVADGFEDGASHAMKVLTHATRVLNAMLTTNNPGFVPVAQIKDFGAAAYNTPGLWRHWAHYLVPSGFDVASLGFQFLPPHLLRRMSETPVLRQLVANPHTIEYWSAFGNRMARMIHSGDFQGALEDARRAWQEGDAAKARELEYLVQMSRAALRDGVLLNMVQFRRMEYDDSEWKALFARYNLDFDERPTAGRGLARSLVGAPMRAVGWAWNKTGDLSEIASATTKLAVYCYLHRDAHPGMGDVTRAASFADPLRRAEAAWRAARLAGDPTFELRGHLMTYMELVGGPFLNARQKGFLRFWDVTDRRPMLTDSGEFRTLSGGRQAAEKAMKFAARWTRRYVSGLLLSGGLSAATLGLYRTLTGREDATEEDMAGTMLGTLNRFFRWTERCLRNCSPYTLSNFDVMPIYVDGDVSLVLTSPIPDEERVPSLLMDALLNKGALPTVDPGARMQDALRETVTSFLNPASGEGSLGVYRRVLAPWLEGENPFDPFLRRPLFSEKAFATRLTTPLAAKEALGRLSSNSPLSMAWRLGDTRNDDLPEGPLKAFHAFVTRTPVLSSIAGRILRVQVGGETARLRRMGMLDEDERMRWKVRADQDFDAFRRTGGFRFPEDIPAPYAADYQERFMKNLNDAAEDPATQRRRERQKAVEAIRDPALRRRAARFHRRGAELLRD